MHTRTFKCPVCQEQISSEPEPTAKAGNSYLEWKLAWAAKKDAFNREHTCDALFEESHEINRKAVTI